MFDFTEEELTWDLVGKWTAKDTDLDYSVIVKHQPMDRMDTLIGSSFYPNGKPYKLIIMYFLKGAHLFIASLKSFKKQNEKDFCYKTLINLKNCSLMTKPVIDRNPPSFLKRTYQASYIGENFFFLKNDDLGFYADEPPYRVAFTLRFPETTCYYDWEDAMKFSGAIKSRIYCSQIQTKS